MIRRIIAIAATTLAVGLIMPTSPANADSGSGSTGKTHAAPAPTGNQAVTCYPVAPHFVNRYNSDPGGFGCAIAPEARYGDGTYQAFEHGEMDWSPSQGGRMVVSGIHHTYWDDYGAHNRVIFQWGPSDPYNYDGWLIYFTINGNYAGQPECRDGWGGDCAGTTRTTGRYVFNSAAGGHWQIKTEGCDISTIGSKNCRQGWTIQVDLNV